MRLWAVAAVGVLLLVQLSEASRADEEDSYGDELLDRKEEQEKKEERRVKVRPSRLRASDRPPRASPPSRVLKLQEEANCPIGCACNRSQISCINADADSSLFLQIQPIAFPALDTLVLTGNRFADMSSTELFGNKNEHDRLTLANFSDNRISAVSQQTFINMPHLEYLYLSNNRISTTSKNPFGGLNKLQKLHLNNALRKTAISKEHLSSMFEARTNQLVHLEKIDLSSNGIKELQQSTFCRVNGVAELLLGKNELTAFEVARNCLNGLRRLDLSSNAFTSFSSALFDSLPNLSSLDISDNPIECSCEMKKFIEFAQKEDSRFLNQASDLPNIWLRYHSAQDRTQCASPPALSGKSIFRLKPEAVCVPKSSNVFSNLFLLALFCTVGFFVYRFYRHRIPSPAIFQFGTLRRRSPPPVYREIGEGGRIVVPSRDGSPDDEESIFENPLYTFDNPAWAR